MMSRLSGVLVGVEGLAAEVAVSGGDICYEVLVPAFLAESLSVRTGSKVKFTTFQYLESQGQGASFLPRLIGFESPKDREFFELFTTVKGIGNRKALRAMAIPPGQIAAAIMAKNARALTELPEIGKRLAETVIAELTGKVDTYLTMEETAALDAAVKPLPPGNPVAEESILALITLGESRADAERLVERAVARVRRSGREPETTESLLAAVFEARGK